MSTDDSVHPSSSVRSTEDELINSILPSYHMFQATVSKKLVPNEENFKEDPPTYEMSPLNSAGLTPIASGIQTPLSLTEPAAFPFPGQMEEAINEGSGDLWETTVLANVHKLVNLSETDNLASALNVQISITESVCQKGVKPNLIDISNQEFKQGDYIHGFVTIKNGSREPIPFDMVYVVFEGNLVVQGSNTLGDQSNPTVFKFLNMLDLFASWSYANIDRLVTDNGDPHDWCDGETDPYDGTVLSIDLKRLFQPGVTYKRFFSFRVPEKLLDDACETHSFDIHCEVPPSIGSACSLHSFKRTPESQKVKDFCFIGTSIYYNVAARVIGRASRYNYKVLSDKYVLAREASIPIRVIPWTSHLEYQDYWLGKTNAFYKAFVESVEKKIEEGRSVLRSFQAPSTSLILSRQLSPVLLTQSHEKIRQLYKFTETVKAPLKEADSQIYQHLSPYRKKALTGYSKVLGVFSLSTPKTEYKTVYVPPLRYRNPLQHYNTTVKIPIDLSYFYEDGQLQVPPEPKKLTCELIVLTVRSKKHYIPVELNHEMCFKDQVVDDVNSKNPADGLDNFDSIVIKPFHDYYHTLVSLMKKIGFDNEAYRVETLIFKDIKSMAMLQTKHINLEVPDVKFASVTENSAGILKDMTSIPWAVAKSSTNSNYHVHTRRMEVVVDLNSCHAKGTSEPGPGKSGFDALTLVPGFQTCLMARFYYVRISVKHRNGTVQAVHVPLSIQS